MVARFLAGLFTRWVNEVRIEIVEANGAPVVLGWEDGELTSFGALEIGEAGITGIRLVRNPDKLTFLANQLPGLSQTS
ncbi:hypothetical protein ACFQ0T_16885 [Kitasatospora gansuensis]